jgi:hypothetical protein
MKCECFIEDIKFVEGLKLFMLQPKTRNGKVIKSFHWLRLTEVSSRGRDSAFFIAPNIILLDITVKNTNTHTECKYVTAKYLSNKMHKYHSHILFLRVYAQPENCNQLSTKSLSGQKKNGE